MSVNWNSVSSEDIRAAYRMFLGRAASDDEAAVWRGTRSLADLRRAFLTSGEFLAAQKAAPQERLSRNLPAAEVEWQVDASTAKRLLVHVKSTWTKLGKERPHWSVLSSDLFLPESIAGNEKAFFESGAAELASLKSAMARHAISASSHVLEFGCGIGRVTKYLADAFPRVTACDISASHLEMARRVLGVRPNTRFNLVEDDRFGMHESFDVWFSYIVLQHNPPPIIAMILRRMFEVLAPGGFAMFQVPTYCTAYRFNVADYLRDTRTGDTIEVHCLPQPVIFRLAHEAGCVPLEVREDSAMGPPSHWLSNTFIFRKPAARARNAVRRILGLLDRLRGIGVKHGAGGSPALPGASSES